MNSSIKNIINVYQYTYCNYTLPIGFGDFLRGCLSLLQICKKYNIECNFYINTPIRQYLKNAIHDESIDAIHSSINYYTNQNTNFNDSNLHNLHDYYEYNNFLDGFVSFCNTTSLYNNKIYILTNPYPIQPVINEERERMQYFLEPNDEMLRYIDINLNSIKLSPNTYNIIHIRVGDDYLVHNNQIPETKLEYITRIVSFHIDNTISYIILSDNNDLSTYITRMKSNCNTIPNMKFHTGITSDANGIKNILLDFYIMSKSKHILSLSVYSHGSSFSKWCAEIYNIPISSFII
jgi:hypothetical protein